MLDYSKYTNEELRKIAVENAARRYQPLPKETEEVIPINYNRTDPLIIAVQCSPSFKNHLRVLTKSIREYQPDSPTVLYSYDGFNPHEDFSEIIPRGDAASITMDRGWIINDLLKRYSKICFLGADTELFAPLNEANEMLSTYDFVICPHLIGKSDWSNADFQLWRRTTSSVKIAQWYLENIGNYDSEQRCLSQIPHKFPTATIWNNKTHNVAYYNCREYNLRQDGGEWITDGGKVVLAHYSGFLVNQPNRLSMYGHQFGEPTEDILKFYRRYAEQLKLN